MSAVIQNEYTGNGSTTTYSFTFPYLKTSDIKASLDGVVTTAFSLQNATTIQFNTAPADQAKIKIFRETGVDNLTATFYAGSAIKSEDLNDNFTQNLFSTQEVSQRYLSQLGGTMTGNIHLAKDVDITYEGDTENDFETRFTVVDPTADRTITFPNVTGTVVTTGDTGTVTGTMLADSTITSGDIVDGTLVNADINASADIAVSKLDHGTARQILQTNAAGNGVEFTSNVDIPGTLDVTGNTDIDGNLNVDGNTTLGGTLDVTGTTTLEATNTTAITNTGKLKLNSFTSFTESGSDYTLSGAHITVGTDDTNALQIFHSPLTNHSFISEVGPGDLCLVTNGTNLFLQKNLTTDGSAEDMIQCIADGPVKLFHNNQLKLATESTGVEVTGNLSASTLSGAAIIADGTSDAENQVYSCHRAGEIFYQKDTLGEIRVGETWSAGDDKVATTAAIDARITELVDNVGGFVPIANETSFPNANPDINNGAGTLVSVPLANNLTSNGSGVISINNGTVGNSTVTITGATANSTFAQGFGIIVETTSTLNTYTFHRYVPKATEVTTVASNVGNVNTVAGISGNVTTVAGISGNVTTVAGISSDVTTVANDGTDIAAVAGKVTEIGRLGTADAVADLTILGTTDAVADMNTLGTSSNVTNMNTLAGISGNITTVAGISSNVTTVANDGTDIGTVAGSISNVNNVGGSISNVNTVAGSIANVNTVAGNNTNVNTVAGISGNVTTVAGISSNVTTVAGNNSNVSTVAGSIANVNTTAGSIANVNTTAVSIANVNTVATNIANVNNASTYLNDFQSLYLGTAASAPSTDTFGNALTEGDLYFNTGNKQLNIFNGSIFTNIVDTAIDFAKSATAAFNALYTASAGSNSIDLGGLAITGAAFANEAIATNRVSLTKGSATYNLGGI